MAFDFDALMQDPQFQMGLGILGGASPGHAGLLNAYNIMQERRKSELAAQHQMQQMEMERTRIEQAKLQAALYERQVRTAEMNEQRQREAAQMYQPMLERFMQQIGGGQQPQQQPFAPAQPTQQEDFFSSRILPIEDGMDPSGKFRTSPKGAVGPAQVMPQTAPEAAQLAGLPFDDFRYRSDANYNIALGRAYFNKQMETFQGDQEKASAAYNAGPAAVQAAILKSRVAGKPDGWLNYLPRETQDYVAKARLPITQPQPAPGQPQPGMAPHQVAQAMGGLMRGAAGDYPGAFEAMGKALKPDYEGQRVDIERGGLAVRQQQAALESNKEQRIAGEKLREANTQFAKDKAAHSMVLSSADRLENAIDDLIKDPGLGSITGLFAYTNPVAIKGGQAYGALSKLKSITSKLVNDTLQAVRQASANGASGYGQFTEKELGVIETYVANLDPGRPDFLQALQQVRDYAKEIKNRSSTLYEESTGKSSIEGLPAGTRKVGTSGGKAVYRLPNGSMVREK